MVPVRYPTPTSKGGQEKQMAITSKGLVQQQVLTIPKIKQVTINSKVDQEPIVKSTRSSIDPENSPTIQSIQTLTEKIAKRTTIRAVTHKA